MGSNTDFQDLQVHGNRDLINLLDYSSYLTLSRPATQINHKKGLDSMISLASMMAPVDQEKNTDFNVHATIMGTERAS